MQDTCAECAGGLDHCHGTLVVHEGHLVECSDPTCADRDVARHGLRLRCWDVDGTCVCGDEQVAPELARAS